MVDRSRRTPLSSFSTDIFGERRECRGRTRVFPMSLSHKMARDIDKLHAGKALTAFRLEVEFERARGKVHIAGGRSSRQWD